MLVSSSQHTGTQLLGLLSQLRFSISVLFFALIASSIIYSFYDFSLDLLLGIAINSMFSCMAVGCDGTAIPFRFPTVKVL